MNRLAADYEIDRQSRVRTPERNLWLAVLRLALVDATSSSPAVRAAARQFIGSPGLLHLMDLVDIDREMAAHASGLEAHDSTTTPGRAAELAP